MAATIFPPGEFIREELAARDWTEEDLAIRMGPEEDFPKNLLTVQLIIEVPEYKGRASRMGHLPKYRMPFRAFPRHHHPGDQIPRQAVSIG